MNESTANPSGAPQAGGATTSNSRFGGQSMLASVLRLLARVARSIESMAYRRLRDLELERTGGRPSDDPGAPRRARAAAEFSDDARIRPA